jgi:rubredoxin
MQEDYPPKCPVCRKRMRPTLLEIEAKGSFSTLPRKWHCDECGALKK